MKVVIFLLLSVFAFCAEPIEPPALSDLDKQKIDSMLEPLSSWSYFRLLKRQKEVTQRGYATEDIPTLKAMGYLFDPKGHKATIHKIKQRSMIWSRFSQGYADRLKELHADGKILPHLDEFAKDLGMDSEGLKAYVEKGDWLGFFNFLLQ